MLSRRSLVYSSRRLVCCVVLLVLAGVFTPWTVVAQAPPPYYGPTVQFESASYACGEDAGPAVVWVTLSEPSDSTVTVKFKTVDGSAKAGTDYDAKTETVTFSPGETLGRVEVVLKPNGTAEGHRSLSMELSDPVNAGLGTPDKATLLILDDDLPPPEVAFGASYYVVGEDAVEAVVTVELSAASASVVRVNYTVSDGPSSDPMWASYPGATDGADYNAQNGTLEFLPGETSQKIIIDILPDDLTEGFETVRLLLDSPVNAVLGPLFLSTLILVDGPPPVDPVTVKIDPVISGRRFNIMSDENAVENPAGIILVANAADRKATNAAIIKITELKGKDGDTNVDQSKLAWTYKSVDKDGKDDANGGQVAFFADKGGAVGKKVWVHGTKEGRVRLEVRKKGDDPDKTPALETYEAWVIPLRTVTFRVNLVQNKAKTKGTKADAVMAGDHVFLANIYLRQVGAVLKPDSDLTELNGAKLVKKGYFTIEREDEASLKPKDWNEGKDLIRLNARDKVAQITYTEWYLSDNTGGAATNWPGNTNGDNKGDTVELVYRMTVDVAAAKKTMRLIGKELRNSAAKEEDKWGFIATNAGGDQEKNQQKYASWLAHEFGHMLTLGHRDATKKDKKGDFIDSWRDDLNEPGNKNMMYPSNLTPTRADFDLIQLFVAGTKAGNGSKMLP